jgi:hypothetical protein
MAKKSGYLDKIASAKREGFITGQLFTRQYCLDQAAIVLNREFGFGSERLEKFCDAMCKMYDECCDIINSDTKDIEYTKSTMDAALKQIYGDKFQPWEVRYGRS